MLTIFNEGSSLTVANKMPTLKKTVVFEKNDMQPYLMSSYMTTQW